MEIITQLIPHISTIIIALGSIWLRDYIIARKLNSKKISPITKSELFIQLTKICGEVKTDLKASGVYIAYFHNGDYYKNGLSIDKFTVVAEDYDETIKQPYICKYQNINVSYISYLYHRLLVNSRCYKVDIPNLTMIDTVYKQDCLNRGVLSTYNFLITDDRQTPIGFISLEYTYEFTFKQEMEQFIWKHQMNIQRKIKDTK